jgi:CheY-like chemotaxis protein
MIAALAATRSIRRWKSSSRVTGRAWCSPISSWPTAVRGSDAVEDLLADRRSVPVIFITAYPERLLTGERPEPTYLVTKPFREEQTVRTAISQALFFGIKSSPLD